MFLTNLFYGTVLPYTITSQTYLDIKLQPPAARLSGIPHILSVMHRIHQQVPELDSTSGQLFFILANPHLNPAEAL